MLKKILIVVVVVVAGFLVYTSTRPDNYHVERSTRIAAAPAVIFAQLESFKAWPAWSPWEKRDPSMKKTYEGPPSGVGSSYAWEGNKEVGKGKMTIVVSEPPQHIRYRLEFKEPFAAVADSGFTLTPEGGKEEGKTVVVWGMDGTHNFLGKIFGTFMDMDKAIGGDFESGLMSLKTVSEEAASRNAAAEAQVAAAAAAQAAQAAAQAATAATAAAETAAAAGAAEATARRKR